jgi:hypothetical protein
MRDWCGNSTSKSTSHAHHGARQPRCRIVAGLAACSACLPRKSKHAHTWPPPRARVETVQDRPESWFWPRPQYADAPAKLSVRGQPRKLGPNDRCWWQDHGIFFRCQTAPWKYSYMLGGMVSLCSLTMCLRTISEYRKRSPQMRQCHWSRAKM